LFFNTKVSIFLEFNMSHDHAHHHVDMVASTPMVMNHAHHMVQEKINTTSVHRGHGSHLKDMMMMSVSI
jgi:hypothetical protein